MISRLVVEEVMAVKAIHAVELELLFNCLGNYQSSEVAVDAFFEEALEASKMEIDSRRLLTV